MLNTKAFCTFTCDRCNCKETVTVPVADATKFWARSIEGSVRYPKDWNHRSGRDLCPRCLEIVDNVLRGDAVVGTLFSRQPRVTPNFEAAPVTRDTRTFVERLRGFAWI